MMSGGVFSFLFSVALFFAPHAHAATLITVCEDRCAYTTIQKAVDAIPAVPLDAYVIEVRDSRAYEEAIVIGGKTTRATRTITIKSGDGASPTLLAPSNQYALSIAVPYVVVDGMQFSGNLRSRANAVKI